MQLLIISRGTYPHPVSALENFGRIADVLQNISIIKNHVNFITNHYLHKPHKPDIAQIPHWGRFLRPADRI